jgi:hypothetical protein
MNVPIMTAPAVATPIRGRLLKPSAALGETMRQSSTMRMAGLSGWRLNGKYADHPNAPYGGPFVVTRRCQSVSMNSRRGELPSPLGATGRDLPHQECIGEAGRGLCLVDQRTLWSVSAASAGQVSGPAVKGWRVPRPMMCGVRRPIDPRPGPDHRPTLMEVTAAIDEHSARTGLFRP